MKCLQYLWREKMAYSGFVGDTQGWVLPRSGLLECVTGDPCTAD